MKPTFGIHTKYRGPGDIKRMKEWCEEQFGAECLVEWAGPTVDYGTGHYWWFIKSEDAAYFALKWT
jgi:hypothetical protein